MKIFNRKLLAMHRSRAAAYLREHNFLYEIVADNLFDRILDCNKSFPASLVMNCPLPSFSSMLRENRKTESITHTDIATGMLNFNPSPKLLVDSEFLPFSVASFDLIINFLDLHFTNDILGCLIQARDVLKPQGLFLAAMFGGDTLYELKTSMLEADLAIRNAVSPHVAPFAHIQDVASLMQRAKFHMPVVDNYTLTVTYPSIIKLMHDLRYMGAANIQLNHPLSRKLLTKAEDIYFSKFATEGNQLQATFEIITLTGIKG
jgi:SAM-dependent methyltransferase